MPDAEGVSLESSDCSESQLIDACRFLNGTFPSAKHLTLDYLRWQYRDNPAGPAVVSNARHEGRIVCHFALQRFHAVLFGEQVMGGLALNVATDPAFRRMGLQTRTGHHAIAVARDAGLDITIAVTNAQSTPGFVSRLGYELICPLDVKVGVGDVPRPVQKGSGDSQFSITRSADEWNWRLARPGTAYFRRPGAEEPRVYSPTYRVLLAPVLELAGQVSGQTTGLPVKGLSPFRIWMGLSAVRNWRGLRFVDLPGCLKPSPLNFLFQDLTTQRRTLESGHIEFEPIDFDAF